MSSVGNHSPGESFLSKIDIFKPIARNNSAEKTSSEAITLWGGGENILPAGISQFWTQENSRFNLLCTSSCRKGHEQFLRTIFFTYTII